MTNSVTPRAAIQAIGQLNHGDEALVLVEKMTKEKSIEGKPTTVMRTTTIALGTFTVVAFIAAGVTAYMVPYSAAMRGAVAGGIAGGALVVSGVIYIVVDQTRNFEKQSVKRRAIKRIEKLTIEQVHRKYSTNAIFYYELLGERSKNANRYKQMENYTHLSNYRAQMNKALSLFRSSHIAGDLAVYMPLAFAADLADSTYNHMLIFSVLSITTQGSQSGIGKGINQCSKEMNEALAVIYVLAIAFVAIYGIGCLFVQAVRAGQIRKDSKEARIKINAIFDAATSLAAIPSEKIQGLLMKKI
jgi:hypothetical protein